MRRSGGRTVVSLTPTSLDARWLRFSTTCGDVGQHAGQDPADRRPGPARERGGPRLGAATLALGAVLERGHERRGEALLVIGLDEPAGAAGVDDVGRAVAI